MWRLQRRSLSFHQSHWRIWWRWKISFSPTPLPSLQQSLITNYLDYLWAFWILRFRPFWTPKYLTPLWKGNGFHPFYPWLTEGHFGQLWKWVDVPGDLHHRWRLLSVKNFAVKLPAAVFVGAFSVVLQPVFPWNGHVTCSSRNSVDG